MKIGFKTSEFALALVLAGFVGYSFYAPHGYTSEMGLLAFGYAIGQFASSRSKAKVGHAGEPLGKR